MGVIPEMVLPKLDEAPWPPGRAPAELERYLAHGSVQEFVATAYAEGWFPGLRGWTADPWGGVLALEALRASGAASAELVEASEKLISMYPDQAAADYARLYLMHASASGSVHDEERSADIAFEVLAATDDVVVARSALAILTNRTIPLDDVRLSVLHGLSREFPDLAWAIAVARIRSATVSGDWVGLALAVEELESLAECDGPTPDELCDGYLAPILEHSMNHLLMQGVAEPRTWIESLRAAALRCYSDGVPVAGLATRGRWDGVWTWQRESGPSAGQRCFESGAAHVVPPRAIEVHLRVLAHPRGEE